MIDHVKADRDWKAKTNPKKSAGGRRGKPEDLIAVQIRKETALAGLRELELEAKGGDMVSVTEMESAWSVVGQTMRDALLSMPERLAPMVAAVSDVRQCRDILLKEIRAVISNVPGRIQAAVGRAV